MKKFFIASDHAAFDLKTQFIKDLSDQFNFIDLGTESNERCDYPFYSKELALNIQNSDSDLLTPQGVLLCGSGVGVCMSANRFKNIRAVNAQSVELAVLSRQHNASNVLCLGARLMSLQKAKQIFIEWQKTEFEGGRHLKRVQMMNDL